MLSVALVTYVRQVIIKMFFIQKYCFIFFYVTVLGTTSSSSSFEPSRLSASSIPKNAIVRYDTFERRKTVNFDLPNTPNAIQYSVTVSVPVFSC